MSDLFGNHIVGFPTRRLNYQRYAVTFSFRKVNNITYICCVFCGLTSKTKKFQSCWDRATASCELTSAVGS